MNIILVDGISLYLSQKTLIKKAIVSPRKMKAVIEKEVFGEEQGGFNYWLDLGLVNTLNYKGKNRQTSFLLEVQKSGFTLLLEEPQEIRTRCKDPESLNNFVFNTFSAKISFILGMLGSKLNGCNIVIVSNDPTLFQPIKECVLLGAKVTLAFFEQDVPLIFAAKKSRKTLVGPGSFNVFYMNHFLKEMQTTELQKLPDDKKSTPAANVFFDGTQRSPINRQAWKELSI